MVTADLICVFSLALDRVPGQRAVPVTVNTYQSIWRLSERVGSQLVELTSGPEASIGWELIAVLVK